MKKACASINGATVPTAGPGGAARGRSSSRQSRGASRFAGRLLTLFAALLLAACGIVPAEWLPPGPAWSVSPESIVVFGKVNLEVKLDVGESLLGSGKLAVMDWGEWWDAPLDEDIYVIFPKKDYAMVWGEWWGVPLDEDFYVILPKKDHVFKSFEYWYDTGGFGYSRGTRVIECSGKMGFHVPPDASAVYVGTLDFEGEKKLGPVTLVVKDEYDQAVRRLRKRNPEFSGSIVKSLFRLQGRSGVTRRSPASDAAMSCESSSPIRGGLIPFMM